MEFKDLNEIDSLTIKADFILNVSQGVEKIDQAIFNLKDNGISYEDAFDMVLKYIEANKITVTDEMIDQLFKSLYNKYEIYNADNKIYSQLLKCYINGDIENYEIANIYTEEFINKSSLTFNMLFAPYYLNVLIERIENLEEINRMNAILKNLIAEFRKQKNRRL